MNIVTQGAFAVLSVMHCYFIIHSNIIASTCIQAIIPILLSHHATETGASDAHSLQCCGCLLCARGSHCFELLIVHPPICVLALTVCCIAVFDSHPALRLDNAWLRQMLDCVKLSSAVGPSVPAVALQPPYSCVSSPMTPVPFTLMSGLS